MSNLALTKRLHPDFWHPRRKPLGSVEIDWSHPLAHELQIAVLPSRWINGTTLRDEVKKVRSGTTLSLAAHPSGVDDGGKWVGYADTTVVNGVYFSCPFSGSQPRAVAFVHKRISSLDKTALTAAGQNTTGARWTLRYVTNALRIEIQGDGHTSTLVPPLNKVTVSGVTLRGSTLGDHYVFSGGVIEKATGTLGVNTASNSDIFVFADGGIQGGEYRVDDHLYLYCVWNRSLSDDEIALFTREPYAFFRPVQRRILVPVSTGGGGSTIIIGQASETDTARAMSHSRALGMGQAAEADGALAVSASRALPTGLSVEVDAALTMTHGRIVAAGLASEGDVGLGMGHARALEAGQAIEAEGAQPFGHGSVVSIGQAPETDAALAVTWSRTLTIGLVQEADQAQPMASSAAVPVGQATESDTALGVSASKRKGTGQAAESDQAFAFASGAAVLIGVAAEAEQAFGLSAAKLAIIGQAPESDAALAFAADRAVAVAEALELDAALVVVPLTGRAIGQAVEADTALAVTSAKLRAIAQALETDTALVIAAAGAVVVPSVPGLEYTLGDGRIHFTLPAGRVHYTIH